MVVHSHLSNFQEIGQAQAQFEHQNKKLLRISLAQGPVQAQSGSMVAYQGDANFTNKGSGGMGKMLKKAMSSETANFMEINGTGEVFLANQGMDVQIMYLENDSVSVNGTNVLAFSSSISWDIKRVGSGVAGAVAGGLHNVFLQGTGFVAVVTDGEPVMLDVAGAATFADPNAAVMWSGGVTMNIKTDTGGMMSMVRGGTGETFQLGFSGEGFVLIQPSEGSMFGAQTGSSGGSGGILGALGN